jgi:hypothetical protein
MGRTFERRDRQRRARDPKLSENRKTDPLLDQDDDDVQQYLPPSRLWKGQRSDDTD